MGGSISYQQPSTVSGEAHTSGSPRGGRALSTARTGYVTGQPQAPPWTPTRLHRARAVASPNSRDAYTANAGSGTISGFTIGRDGSLALLNPDGITANLGAGSHPLDEAVTSDGDFLYNLTDSQHAITALAVARDGSRSPASTVSARPPARSGPPLS